MQTKFGESHVEPGKNGHKKLQISENPAFVLSKVPVTRQSEIGILKEQTIIKAQKLVLPVFEH